MSSAGLEPTDVAGVRRLSRRYPYPTASPAAPAPSGESPSTPSHSAKDSLEPRNAVSSAFRAPLCIPGTRSAPLEFVPVVRTEHGFSVPRRELANTLLSKEDKRKIAKRLVECAMNILSSAWRVVETGPFVVASTPSGDDATHNAPPRPYDGSQYPYQATSDHMPLRKFVHEVLRRSCTPFFTLQTALSYLEAVAAQLPILVKEEVSYMHKRAEPGYVPQADDASPEVPALPSPLLCPRRTFLASLLLASKFFYDRSYSCRSWMKLTGLHGPEVSRAERALWTALDHRLWFNKGSEPAPSIADLDSKPVIELSVAYQPEPERAAPQMLRKTRSDVAVASSAASADGPTPCPVQHHPLPTSKTLGAAVAPAAIGECTTDPSKWSDAAPLDLPPMLSHVSTDLPHPCSRWQDAYLDGVTSLSLAPGLPPLSRTQSSSDDLVLTLDPSTMETMDAGVQGHVRKGH